MQRSEDQWQGSGHEIREALGRAGHVLQRDLNDHNETVGVDEGDTLVSVSVYPTIFSIYEHYRNQSDEISYIERHRGGREK